MRNANNFNEYWSDSIPLLQLTVPNEPLRFRSHVNPIVSVVLPVHNNYLTTYKCLASLFVAGDVAPFEVIVVDDGALDQSCELISMVIGIRYVRNEVLAGFVHSCNLGVSYAKGQYILLLNNHTQATVGWLDELLRVFANLRGVGLVGSKILNSDGVLQSAGGLVFGDGSIAIYGRNGDANEPRYCYTREVDFLSHLCLMLPRSLWNDIGGFSASFASACFKEIDFAFRICEKGYKIVYAPLSQVTHIERDSNGLMSGIDTRKVQLIDKAKLKARWLHAFKKLDNQRCDLEFIKDRNVVRRALVLDAETPMPDVNAGSYAAIQEMRLLQALGYKCTFVAQNMALLDGYTSSLQRMGIECIFAPFAVSVREVLETRGAEFDLVYVTRYSVAKETIAYIRQFAGAAKTVLMNADLHFLRELRAALYNNSDEGLTKATETREDELAVMRKVDLVLTYTEVEKTVILSHNLASTKVALCPWICEPISKVKPYRSRVDLVFLGGFRHPPNLEAVQWFISNVLQGLSAVAPEICLRIYGSHIPKVLLDLAKVQPQLIIEGWVADINTVYESCRVFIAPLQSGAGIKGKVVGALAHGVPCVLSNIAAEGIPIGDRVQASIAYQPQDWIDRILEIYKSESIWTSMSDNALKFASLNYGFEKGVLNMQSALAVAGIHTEINNTALAWCKP